jgi:hypothetical protein
VHELLGIDDPLVKHLAQKPLFPEDAVSCRNQERMHPKTPVSRIDCPQDRRVLAIFSMAKPGNLSPQSASFIGKALEIRRH